MDRLQIVVEVDFNGNVVGCGAGAVTPANRSRRFMAPQADAYPRDINFSKIWPPQPQRVDDANASAIRKLCTALPPACWKK